MQISRRSFVAGFTAVSALAFLGLGPQTARGTYLGMNITCSVTPNPAIAYQTVKVSACGFHPHATSAEVRACLEQPDGSYLCQRERTVNVVDRCLADLGATFGVPNVPSIRFEILVDGEVVCSETVSVQQA